MLKSDADPDGIPGADFAFVMNTVLDTPLRVAPIESALAEAGWTARCAVEVIAETGSTNEDLIARARMAQPPVPILRAADFQHRGRGRQGRAWRAAPRQALLFSVAFPLAGMPDKLPSITLSCAVAVAERLAAHGATVQLKWPNDIRAGGHKLAGILSELTADANGRYTVVVGVGLNLHADRARLGIEQPVAALDELLPPDQLDRCTWIGRMAAAILAAATQFQQEGFAPFRPRFNALLEARGQVVDVVDGESSVASGRLVEVDDTGRLMLEAGGIVRGISVGDISLRTGG
jgi:BirA family biotin operon repressor/biotin-[acetyl-CoA-carboxylase] ligase